MNWDRVETNWRPLKGKFKEQWNLLNDSQLEMIAGKRERRVRTLQESYGLPKEEVEQRVKVWEMNEQRAAEFEQVLRRTGELV